MTLNPCSRIPQPLTRLVGREDEVLAIRAILADTRLVTLTGAGGVGKTRLAIQVAEESAEDYTDGAWFVELAALSDAALVPQRVATVLEVAEQPACPLVETLAAFLRPRQLLLVLDNCEHLVEACAPLAESLLREGPHLRILVTSRQPLGLVGEASRRVPSLAVPDAPSPGSEQLSPEALLQYAAVRLFVERALAATPDFALTARNAPAAVHICRSLDGIPLAIELAAARVKALSVEQIAARLDNWVRLLTGGSRTALPRHRTLRATIDWSYDLLAEPEQILLRRLSVFAGGWTLEAAEAVCSDEGCWVSGVRSWDSDAASQHPTPNTQHLTPDEVLDLLTSLVDKSLVMAEEREEQARYRLLETVRQYAHDRLLEAGEGTPVRARHRDWFLALAEEAGPGLRGKSETVWLDRLEREHDNLRAALAWSGAQGQGEAGLRLGGALWPFWEVRGYYGEGREHLAGVLALPGAEARTAARAKALYGAGALARHQGDFGGARTRFEESLALFRELGDKPGIARSLGGLGWVTDSQLDFAGARALFEESLAINRELGNKRDIANSLSNLGMAAHNQGDYGAAWAFSEEALAISRELGYKGGIVRALGGLGWAANAQGDYGGARALLEGSLAIAREMGHKGGTTWALWALGYLAERQGDYGAARALWEERLAMRQEDGSKPAIAVSLIELGHVARLQGDSGAARAFREDCLAIVREAGDKQGIVNNLEGLASFAVAQAQSERAAHLFGAAEGLRELIGAPLPPADRAGHDRSVAAVRTALGEEAFTAAWAHGRAMTLEVAATYALEGRETG